MPHLKPYLLFPGCLIETQYPFLEKLAYNVLPRMGISLEREKGFLCCPEPIQFRGASEFTWLALAARNLCQAEQRGLDIITLCNGCINTLAIANYKLKKELSLRQQVNECLSEINYEYHGTVEVKHFLQVLHDDIGVDKIKQLVNFPLDFLRAATHPGCHLLNPVDVIGFDDPQDPVKFDNLMTSLNAEVIEYSTKTICCGLSLSTTGDRKGSFNAIQTKLEDVQAYNGNCIVVGCPFCFRQFDSGQKLHKSRLNIKHPIPVYYYLQLLALAIGIPFQDTFLLKHKIKDPSHLVAFQKG